MSRVVTITPAPESHPPRTLAAAASLIMRSSGTPFFLDRLAAAPTFDQPFYPASDPMAGPVTRARSKRTPAPRADIRTKRQVVLTGRKR
jgi:hypothetical protein